MKKNIKTKTNHFRLSVTLTLELKLLNSKHLFGEKKLFTDGCGKVFRQEKKKAFTLPQPFTLVNFTY
ncbi:hypothetical protein [Vibrio vulnificus]|uniref:hypothetical protein n=1 Tax=Vibrio vulnificus TaxID=672 RepID=UPI000927C517|nr:hypothetical protein [Vibrio vulnificus]EJE8694993.1 hypothetical protein [Vibrio vulnificus]OJI42616.1 hypothetical protein VVATL9824_03581 [Vibrio vulnificus]POB21809.1 hypothetical protein CRN22_19740 [Vibrio vulnificus]HAS8130865.1 hypothetical protein [Vibrio vulnificus]